MTLRLLLLSAFAAAIAAGTPASRAETRVCTPITALPAVLSSPGVYCFTGDLSTGMTSGRAITLAGHAITVDCNGYKLGGLAGGAQSQAIGIGTQYGAEHAVIRNCNIRGFRTGIEVAGIALRILDNRLDGNLGTGIHVGGAHNEIRGNRVFDTGGNSSATGIRVVGSAHVAGNTVAGVVAASPLPAIGIAVQTADALVLEGNRVRGVSAAAPSPDPVGIHLKAVVATTSVGNHAVGDGAGIGLHCEDSAPPLTVDTTLAGFQTMELGCSNESK